MEERILEQAAIARFREHLILEEKSPATVEKYLRDIRAFAVYMRGEVVRKAAVIDYKKLLQKKYAVRSVNSTVTVHNTAKDREKPWESRSIIRKLSIPRRLSLFKAYQYLGCHGGFLLTVVTRNATISHQSAAANRCDTGLCGYFSQI